MVLLEYEVKHQNQISPDDCLERGSRCAVAFELHTNWKRWRNPPHVFALFSAGKRLRRDWLSHTFWRLSHEFDVLVVRVNSYRVYNPRPWRVASVKKKKVQILLCQRLERNKGKMNEDESPNFFIFFYSFLLFFFFSQTLEYKIKVFKFFDEKFSNKPLNSGNGISLLELV